jgi:glutamate formiminotransferase
MPLVECVANVSEGRRQDVIEAGASAIRQAGAALLDLHTDAVHHRSVYTFAGDDRVVGEAALALGDVAVRHIDLRAHDGVHPRIGALDVVPFVPLDGSIALCVGLAHRFGAAFAARHEVPVFLYELAARAGHRERLEQIRRGGLPALTARMSQPGWQPDFGPNRPHLSAGASAVGARHLLIAFNVNLATTQLEVADRIARLVRQSSGGLPAVKALGLRLAPAVVQVSMNLIDFRVTSPRQVFDRIAEAASREGVEVLESELVGLVPAAALSPPDVAVLRLRGFDGSQVLEERLARPL